MAGCDTLELSCRWEPLTVLNSEQHRGCMAVISGQIIGQAKQWRRDFHRRPEPGLHEHGTAKIISELLVSFGLEVHTGIAETGVIATLRHGEGPSIGLRADIDALPIHELN